MSIRKYHSLVCDGPGCYATTRQHLAPSDAKREAKLGGWIRVKRTPERLAADYCLDCTDHAGDRK